MNSEQITEKMKSLRLFGMAETYDQRLAQARDSSLSYEEMLSTMLLDEIQYKDQSSLAKRISAAKFEEPKCFDNFDLKQYQDKAGYTLFNDRLFFKRQKSHYYHGTCGYR